MSGESDGALPSNLMLVVHHLPAALPAALPCPARTSAAANLVRHASNGTFGNTGTSLLPPQLPPPTAASLLASGRTMSALPLASPLPALMYAAACVERKGKRKMRRHQTKA
jgi:hypothetical protein